MLYRYYLIYSVLLVASKLGFVKPDKSCLINVELLPNEMVKIINDEELCDCLGYKKPEFETPDYKTKPCELKTSTLDGKVSFSASSICKCVGYSIGPVKISPGLSEKNLTITVDYLPKAGDSDSSINSTKAISEIKSTEMTYNYSKELDTHEKTHETGSTSMIAVKRETHDYSVSKAFTTEATYNYSKEVGTHDEKTLETGSYSITAADTEVHNYSISETKSIEVTYNYSKEVETHSEKIPVPITFENNTSTTDDIYSKLSTSINITEYVSDDFSLNAIEDNNVSPLLVININESKPESLNEEDRRDFETEVFSIDETSDPIPTLPFISSIKDELIIPKSRVDDDKNYDDEDSDDYYDEDHEELPALSLTSTLINKNKTTTPGHWDDFISDFADGSGLGDGSNFIDSDIIMRTKEQNPGTRSSNIYEDSKTNSTIMEKTSETDNSNLWRIVTISISLLLTSLIVVFMAIYLYSWCYKKGSYDLQRRGGGNIELGPK